MNVLKDQEKRRYDAVLKLNRVTQSNWFTTLKKWVYQLQLKIRFSILQSK